MTCPISSTTNKSLSATNMLLILWTDKEPILTHISPKTAIPATEITNNIIKIMDKEIKLISMNKWLMKKHKIMSECEGEEIRMSPTNLFPT